MIKISLRILTVLSCWCLTTASNKNSTIIIVGAGPSGIAAATKLLENNFNNLIILEAEPRIGGRINSVKFGDAYVDMGAAWCHGQTNNIVYETVKDMNLLGHDDFSTMIYHSSGKHIDDEFSKELFAIIDEILEDDGDIVGYQTLGDFCEKKFNETVHEKFSNDKTKLDLALSLTYFFESYVLGGDGAFSWHNITTNADYQDFPGDKLQNWKGKGYKTFLDILMKKYPDPSKKLPIDDKIFLNKEVSKIGWNRSENKRVEVQCVDGTVYEGDIVIFTPSVGVLKDKAEDMFIPKLPERKTEAIESIGLDAVLKVYMHFPEIWWNFTGVNLIWSEEDRKAVADDFPHGPKSNGYSWITYMVYVMETDKSNPNVLLAWFVGKAVPDIELLSNQTLVEGITFTLRKLLGHDYNISQPDQIIWSQWYSNPHFRGTYSFQTPKAHNISAESILAEPVKNTDEVSVLLFAGEATNPTHYGTVQGAVETGYREADRIINLV